MGQCCGRTVSLILREYANTGNVLPQRASGFQSASQPNVSVRCGATTTQNFSPTMAATTAVRVDAGGHRTWTTRIDTWETDVGFSGGSSTFAATTAISTLFQIERYDRGSGPALQCTFSVPNGTYTVNLYFAEIWSACFSVGCRAFVLVRPPSRTSISSWR